MGTPTAEQVRARRAALKLLAEGRATAAEVAWLAGVNRQNVTYWVKCANLDPVTLRAKHLLQLWAVLFDKRKRSE